MGEKDNSYTYKGSGVNSQGNHWYSKDYGPDVPNQNAYHYSNQDGSYFYNNPDGSRYYNDGRGGGWYEPPPKNSSPHRNSIDVEPVRISTESRSRGVSPNHTSFRSVSRDRSPSKSPSKLELIFGDKPGWGSPVSALTQEPSPSPSRSPSPTSASRQSRTWERQEFHVQSTPSRKSNSDLTEDRYRDDHHTAPASEPRRDSHYFVSTHARKPYAEPQFERPHAPIPRGGDSNSDRGEPQSATIVASDSDSDSDSGSDSGSSHHGEFFEAKEHHNREVFHSHSEDDEEGSGESCDSDEGSLSDGGLDVDFGGGDDDDGDSD